MIENADATPPHLDVFLAFGKLMRYACFLAVLLQGVAQSFVCMMLYLRKRGLVNQGVWFTSSPGEPRVWFTCRVGEPSVCLTSGLGEPKFGSSAQVGVPLGSFHVLSSMIFFLCLGSSGDLLGLLKFICND